MKRATQKKPKKHRARRRTSGRPTTLTPELYGKLVKHVSDYGFVTTAARLEGVSVKTVEEWLRRGRGVEPGRPPNALYAGFAADIAKAQGANVARRMQRIEDVAKGGFVIEKRSETRRDGTIVETEKVQAPDWRADAWAAERLDPENLGQRTQTRVEGAITVKHVDALAFGLLGLLRRYVPEDRLEAVALEVGQIVDQALGTPRLQITGPVQPDSERGATG